MRNYLCICLSTISLTWNYNDIISRKIDGILKKIFTKSVQNAYTSSDLPPQHYKRKYQLCFFIDEKICEKEYLINSQSVLQNARIITAIGKTIKTCNCFESFTVTCFLSLLPLYDCLCYVMSLLRNMFVIIALEQRNKLVCL